MSVTGAGGAIVFGQSAPATESRSRWPGSGPVGAGVEEQRRRRTPRRAPAGRRGRVAEGQVERAARDQRRGAVGEDVAELHRQRRGRRGGAETRSRTTGCPTTSGWASQSHVSEWASSSRWSPDSPHGRWPAQSIQADVADVRLDGQRARPVARRTSRRRRGDRPRPAHPEALVLLEVGLRDGRGADEDVGTVGPLVGGGPAQPPVPPGDHLVVEVDPRAGDRGGRVGVRPRSGQQPPRRAGRAEPLDGAEGVVAVAVGPAGHDHRGALDPVVADVPQRAGLPVRAVPVLAQPGEQPRLVGLPAPLPLRAPVARRPLGGDGRQHAHRRHVVAVVDEVDQPQRVAAPVHVVGPAVVAGVDRHDRLERRRPLGRDLERVEAGVRRAEHPDVAVAPLLLGQPGDHGAEVGPLDERVLVGRVAGRRAGAAQVDAAHGVRVLVAEAAVALGVRRGEVVLAVGQRLEQARLRLGGVRQEERRGQLDAVRHRDADRALSFRPRPCSRSSRTTVSGSSPSLVLPSRPTVVGDISSELSTDSSAASTTASNRSSSPRPPSRGPSSRTVPSRSVRAVVLDGQEDLAAAVVGGRAGAGQAEPDPAGQPLAAGRVDRCVGDDDADAGAGRLRRAGRPPGSSRPTGTPSTVSRSRWPKLVISSTATVWPPGVTRDEVPIPPLKPRHDMPGPADPTAPSSGGAAEPRDASAASWAARTSSAVTHIVRMSLRKESSHSATTGTKMSSTISGCRSSSSSNAAS